MWVCESHARRATAALLKLVKSWSMMCIFMSCVVVVFLTQWARECFLKLIALGAINIIHYHEAM